MVRRLGQPGRYGKHHSPLPEMIESLQHRPSSLGHFRANAGEWTVR